MKNFFNLYNHGFVRVAVAVPQVQVADPTFNVTEIIALAQQAAAQNAVLTVFPELGVTAYSNEDLFHQQALLETAEREVQRLLAETSELNTILIVGAPLLIDSFLYNCALVLLRGCLLGIVPKSYLPNQREFYESRQFRPTQTAINNTVDYGQQTAIPFGSDLKFKVANLPHFTFAVEIGEDLTVPIPPSSFAALAGATVIANPAASPLTVGKAASRHTLLAAQSARCRAAYLYAAAGLGESTTDLAWDGHALIYENGQALAEAPRFSLSSTLTLSELDLAGLTQERLHDNTFADNSLLLQAQNKHYRTITCEIPIPSAKLMLTRTLPRFPYVPANKTALAQQCFEAMQIQVQGLVKRLQSTGITKIIIGVSGGLDSTLALLVAVKAIDLLGLPRHNIRAYSMPGFATSHRTKANAWQLMQALGVYAEELDIRPSSQQMLADIGHPVTRGETRYDATYENVQAGQRTAILFRLANLHQGLVLGTGDLSELALGWLTYGVGDHMSHYNVNASVPKTLIRALLQWQAEAEEIAQKTAAIILDVLKTEISPELVPGTDDDNQPAQHTEDYIGPYELQDFHIYYTLRYGFRPSKIAFLAYNAWGAKYSLEEIKHWLTIFLKRFFASSQFKRSAMPNAPKVVSTSLSPRGDWRAPSDAVATAWLTELASWDL
ncbi:MAG TPA: NAD(+) synthase [Oscillospiraceae bacterium]|nr:NAD(+) synthase [Oscillospiraceae bacterium]